MLETPDSVIPHRGKVMTIGKSADKSYAYLLGVYLGDGCVTHTADGYPVFRLNTIDEDFALAVKAALGDLTEYPVNINKHDVSKSSKPNYSLRCGDPKLCASLRADCNGKLALPKLKTRELRKAFIVGLMDSEGFVAKMTRSNTGRCYYMGYKSCDPWVMSHLIPLMQSVGLRMGKVQTEKPLRAGYKAPTRFSIKMQSWVDSGMRFNIKRKQERVDLWASTEPYTERSRYPRKLISETARGTAICG